MLRFKILLVLSSLFSCSLATGDGSAQVLQYNFQRQGDAQYQFSFETSNGIKRDEIGDEIPSIHDANNNAAHIRGSFSYPGADGKIYTVTFLADEAGFHPEGDHLRIPPFTPWIPGQPIDDGQYKYDNSGDYKPDNSGQDKPENGEGEDSPIILDAKNFKPQKINPPNNLGLKQPLNSESVQNGKPQLTNSGFPQNHVAPNNPGSPQSNVGSNNPLFQPKNEFEDDNGPRTSLTSEKKPSAYISGERILNAFHSTTSPPKTTGKYLPTLEPQKTSYISGENILDTYLTAKKGSSPATQKYLPTSSTPEVYTSEENILDADRKSSRPTPKYLPSPVTTKLNSITTENPLDNDLIRKAFFNKPTPHPDILLRSTPKAQINSQEATQDRL